MDVIAIVNLMGHTYGHVVGRPAGRVLCSFIDGVIWKLCQIQVRMIRQRDVRKVF
jgi:hypothetical protein